MTTDEAKTLILWAKKNGVLKISFDGLSVELHPNAVRFKQDVKKKASKKARDDVSEFVVHDMTLENLMPPLGDFDAEVPRV